MSTHMCLSRLVRWCFDGRFWYFKATQRWPGINHRGQSFDGMLGTVAEYVRISTGSVGLHPRALDKLLRPQ